MIKIPPCFFRISIKALVFNHQNQFLLLQEPNGYWDLPGGGIEHQENHVECLKRELWEEMRVLPKHIEENPSYFLTFLNRKNVYLANVIYQTELESLDFTKTEECINIKFFSKEDVVNNPTIFYENVFKFASMLK